MTKRVREKAIQFGLFPVVVTAVHRLSDHFVRVSLAGPSLKYASEGISLGAGEVFDAYIKLFVPPAGSVTPVHRELTEGWYRAYMAEEPAIRGWLRTYTVRDSRLVGANSLPNICTLPTVAEGAKLPEPIDNPATVPEIDVDFVLHQDSAGTMGPGATWAATAQAGDLVSFLAPLRGAPLWKSWNPADSARVIIIADETAVPAALSITRSFEHTVRADLLLEVPSPADILSDSAETTRLQNFAHVNVHWLPRLHNGSVKRGEELYRCLRKILGLTQSETPPAIESVGAEELVWGLADEQHETYVFIAGESSVIKTLRRICIHEAGFKKSDISFMGYWKRGRAES